MAKLSKKYLTDYDFQAQEAQNHNMIISLILHMLRERCGYTTMMTTLCLINFAAVNTKSDDKDDTDTAQDRLESVYDIVSNLINDQEKEND